VCSLTLQVLVLELRKALHRYCDTKLLYTIPVK
jgi:hypothetical protein